MIKGSLKIRMEYEQHIRECEFYDETPFVPLAQFCDKIYRYYRLKKYRNGELSVAEIDSFNLALFIKSCLCKVAGVTYVCLLNEILPVILKKLPSVPPTYFVEAEEIAGMFLNYPRIILETTMIKAESPYANTAKAINAYESKNIIELTDSISNCNQDAFWLTYVVMTSFEIITSSFMPQSTSNNRDLSKLRNAYDDLFYILEEWEDKHTNSSAIAKLDNLQDKGIDRLQNIINSIENNDIDTLRQFLSTSIFAVSIIHDFSSELLGINDPVVQTLGNIINSPIYQQISRMYEQFLDRTKINQYYLSFDKIMSDFSTNGDGTKEIQESLEAATSIMENYLDDNFRFEGDDKRKFKELYLSGISEFYLNINSGISLYGFASLFYPKVPKRGTGSYDLITNSIRLIGGLTWKKSPEDLASVVKSIVSLNPNRLQQYESSCSEESIRSSKIYEYLAKVTNEYRWIQSFISTYWHELAKSKYDKKLNPKKK